MKNFIIKYRSLIPDTFNGVRNDDPLRSVTVEAMSPSSASQKLRASNNDVNYIVSVTEA
jgi:hypothetical protein